MRDRAPDRRRIDAVAPHHEFQRDLREHRRVLVAPLAARVHLHPRHPLVLAGQRALRELWGETRPLGTWDFSTNGTYWAGKAHIPAIGLGPGDEVTAHTMDENVPLDDVVRAAEWYAWLPKVMAEMNR